MALSDILDAYGNVVSKIGNTAKAISGYATKGNSLFRSNDADTSDKIRDLYLGGFLKDEPAFSPDVFSRLFDEPTYLTFRIEFMFDYNAYIEDLYGDYSTQYDYFPEPLLVIPSENDKQFAKGIAKYSSYNYLGNNLGDYYRQDILWLFVKGLKDLTENYSYYFQSVEGLGDLMKVNPSNGIRIKNDEGIIKIKCYEGLDLKVTQLMQLYRKAVWDDVYQRWILPDMMRYFAMKIYVSEIRLFHSMSSQTHSRSGAMYDIPGTRNRNIYDVASNELLRKVDNIIETASAISTRFLGTNSIVSRALEKANTTVDAVENFLTLPGDYIRLCNNAINDVMPTICLECHQCEFVIDDTLAHINTLSSSNSKEQTEPSIAIKVGRLVDKQIYPLNVRLQTAHDRYIIPTEGNDMSGMYLDDNILRKAYDYTNDQFKLDDRAREFEVDTRISSGKKRIRSQINTETNDAMAYELFNAPKTTTAMSLTYSILNQFRPEEALSAATTIREIKSSLDHGTYAQMIKSMATNEEMQNRIKYNVFTNILDNISKSTATENALTRMSRELLYYMQEQANEYRSKATEVQPDIEI